MEKKDFPEQQQVFTIELNYKKESHIIFSIKSCDENSVTYTYVQPEEKAGQSITFSISIEE